MKHLEEDFRAKLIAMVRADSALCHLPLLQMRVLPLVLRRVRTFSSARSSPLFEFKGRGWRSTYGSHDTHYSADVYIMCVATWPKGAPNQTLPLATMTEHLPNTKQSLLIMFSHHLYFEG